jgi:hypothetical protein
MGSARHKQSPGEETQRARAHRLFRFSELTACTVAAVDDDLGIVDDLYVDPASWKLRYLGVIAEYHATATTVLIPPFALEPIGVLPGELEVQLLRQEVLQAPGILPGTPVTRDQEKRLYAHYGWPGYWETGDVPVRPGLAQTPYPVRPARDLIGLRVDGSEGELGSVEDLLVDDLLWDLRYLQVDPRDSGLEGCCLVSTRWLATKDWRGRLRCQELSASALRDGPRFGSAARISPKDEVDLHRYFSRPLDPD